MFSSRLTKSDVNLEAYMQDDEEDAANEIKLSQEENVESKKPDYANDSDPVYRPSQPYQQEETIYQAGISRQFQSPRRSASLCMKNFR